jgi:hypothetical protein
MIGRWGRKNSAWVDGRALRMMTRAVARSSIYHRSTDAQADRRYRHRHGTPCNGTSCGSHNHVVSWTASPSETAGAAGRRPRDTARAAAHAPDQGGHERPG